MLKRVCNRNALSAKNLPVVVMNVVIYFSDKLMFWLPILLSRLHINSKSCCVVVSPDTFNFVHEDRITSVSRDLSSLSDSALGNLLTSSISCPAYVMENGTCLCTNTLVILYMEANKLVRGFYFVMFYYKIWCF